MSAIKLFKTLLLVFVFLVVGFVIGFYYPNIKSLLVSKVIHWDDTDENIWPPGFSVIAIPSSLDRIDQLAYFYKGRQKTPQPLVVSLHTWSGDYTQKDPLASLISDEGWNYIHPDFRGPNWTEDACLSSKALADIDDSIQYAIDNSNIDPSNIFVVGVSGGAYATLGAYLKSKHEIKASISWVPISDLSAWYYQSLNRKSDYATHISKCTSSSDEGLDENEAIKRSPLFWDVPDTLNGDLELYAGLDDGYTGSVPVSHSILFYNHLVKSRNADGEIVPYQDVLDILTRGIDKVAHLGEIDGRKVLYKNEIDQVSLTIFEGGHEMLPEYTVKRLKEYVDQTK